MGEDVTQPLARKLTSSATFKQEAKEEKVDAFDEGFVDIEGTEVSSFGILSRNPMCHVK